MKEQSEALLTLLANTPAVREAIAAHALEIANERRALIATSESEQRAFDNDTFPPLSRETAEATKDFQQKETELATAKTRLQKAQRAEFVARSSHDQQQDRRLAILRQSAPAVIDTTVSARTEELEQLLSKQPMEGVGIPAAHNRRIEALRRHIQSLDELRVVCVGERDAVSRIENLKREQLFEVGEIKGEN